MSIKEETVRHVSGRLRRIIARHIRIEKLSIQVGESLTVSPGEARAIQALGQNRGVNINTLGVLLGVTRSASSQMVGKLVKKGLVEKHASECNNKEINIYLTKIGEEAFANHEAFHEKYFVELLDRLSGFSDTQIATAATILSVFEDVMDERMEELFDV